MKSPMANHSYSVEWSKSVVENKDKPPGPARPTWFKNQYSTKATITIVSEF